MGYETRDRIINTSRVYGLFSLPIYWFIFFLARIYSSIGFRLQVVGRHNLRKVRGEGCFIISNHTLYLDPAIIASALAPRRARYSALKRTFSMPFVGNFIRCLGAFPIPEDNGLGKLLPVIRRMLGRGDLVHFFPEGDLRLKNQEPGHFSNGVFFFATHFNRPIIPVTIVLLPAVILGHRLSSRFFSVKAVIGEPIYPERFKRDGSGRRHMLEAMSRHACQVMTDCILTERSRALLPQRRGTAPASPETRSPGPAPEPAARGAA